jgi:hypothetical protein
MKSLQPFLLSAFATSAAIDRQIAEEVRWRREKYYTLWSEMTKEELEEEVKWRTKDQDELWERIDYLQACYNQKTYDSKELLTTTTQILLETNSRLLQLRRHAEGLEDNAQAMQKEIEKLKEDLETNGINDERKTLQRLNDVACRLPPNLFAALHQAA